MEEKRQLPVKPEKATLKPDSRRERKSLAIILSDFLHDIGMSLRAAAQPTVSTEVRRVESKKKNLLSLEEVRQRFEGLGVDLRIDEDRYRDIYVYRGHGLTILSQEYSAALKSLSREEMLVISEAFAARGLDTETLRTVLLKGQPPFGEFIQRLKI